ncbi:RNA polymerase sigma-70 factor [Coprobacter tertius]|uniref:RNA polymerase sigma-70 factor n=1 Tax=Coprobacter tertius TaxID=2944915 RepID=A0ABT1MIU2_9BACT|nr:RNA polymerase sigma-70 factor [Coprobacter tertius]MCP9612542.1 RNA polymerase sigma-70 factor [Coprobacter tertius]
MDLQQKEDIINYNEPIIKAIRRGDESCFELIYRFYFKGLCLFANKYVSLHEAEEIVQDTMLFLWENRLDLKPEMSLKSLLFTIVKNKALNRQAHESMKSKVMQDMIARYEEIFDDPDFYLENELMALFSNALNKMPKEFRITFDMNRIDGLTHKEIASRLNISPQTVNYRICQILKRLREDLKDYLPFVLLFLLSV